MASPPPFVPAQAPSAGGPELLQPTLVIQTRVFDGILVGIATAALAGAAWWAVASMTEIERWPFISVFVGLAVGHGVVIGTRRGGLVAGIEAVVISAIAVVVAVYFIDRSFTVSALTDAGRTIDVPLWEGFAQARAVFDSWWNFDRLQVAGWFLAPVAALVVAAVPSRRPVI